MEINSCSINKILVTEKEQEKIIGLCHGCFDIIHYGHIEHFRIAKEQCDILFVSVTSDEYINKGPGRPYNRLEHRIMVLSALKYIDYIFESNQPDAIWSINQVKPNVYFKGSDYCEGKSFNKNFNIEKEHAKMLGAKIVYTNGKTHSSTYLYNQIKNNSEISRHF